MGVGEIDPEEVRLEYQRTPPGYTDEQAEHLEEKLTEIIVRPTIKELQSDA